MDFCFLCSSSSCPAFHFHHGWLPRLIPRTVQPCFGPGFLGVIVCMLFIVINLKGTSRLILRATLPKDKPAWGPVPLLSTWSPFSGSDS